jgi:hypothetical protein
MFGVVGAVLQLGGWPAALGLAALLDQLPR